MTYIMAITESTNPTAKGNTNGRLFRGQYITE